MADRVFPTVHLLVPCESAHHESEEVILANPWATIILPEGASFPFDLDDLCVFAQLTDGVGSLELSVEMCQHYDDGTVRIVGTGSWMPVTFSGGTQLGVYDAVFHLSNVPFDEAGLYEFRIVADDVVLDGHRAILRILDWGPLP